MVSRQSLRTGLIALGAVALTFLGAGAALAQRPAGQGPRSFRRPAVLDVTGAKVANLNPIAKMLKERKKLALTDDQAARIDSINTVLGKDIAMFVSEIDSLKARMVERGGNGARRGGGGPGGFRPRGGGGDDERGDAAGPMARLVDDVAQVKLRYDAALLDVSRVLTDDQRHHAAKLVEKEQARMEEYATPAGRRPIG